MAFKPLTLSATTSCVSATDPAIDWDALAAREIEANPKLGDIEAADERQRKAIDAFLEKFTGEAFKNPSAAEKLLLFKDGARPTRFVLGVIPSEEMVRISDECRDKDGELQPNLLQWRAFLAALRDVEEFGGEVPKVKVGDTERVDPAWVKKTFVRGLRKVALNVGLIAWSWNQLTDDDAKN